MLTLGDARYAMVISQQEHLANLNPEKLHAEQELQYCRNHLLTNFPKGAQLTPEQFENKLDAKQNVTIAYSNLESINKDIALAQGTNYVSSNDTHGKRPSYGPSSSNKR